jgi:hypothetical protein
MTKPVILIEDSSALRAWMQQPDETSLLYTYFKYFLQLGPQRNLNELQKVLLKADEIRETPNVATLRDHSKEWKWAWRAELFDRHDLATKSRLEAERRREEMRIGLEEYARFQNQLGKGMASLAAKVLAKTTAAVDAAPVGEWNLDRASRFMATLNSTAITAANAWSDSLGVEKLNAALAEMDAQAANESEKIHAAKPMG